METPVDVIREALDVWEEWALEPVELTEIAAARAALRELRREAEVLLGLRPTDEEAA